VVTDKVDDDEENGLTPSASIRVVYSRVYVTEVDLAHETVNLEKTTLVTERPG
jgi:hypothetical protein